MIHHYTFSAPGRTEISGNHTDHQHGCVLAAAVNLETVADVELNDSHLIRVDSEGYPLVEIDLNDLNIHDDEKNSTAARFLKFLIIQYIRSISSLNIP